MIVYFVRHASAGQSKSDPAKDDKRPLDKDGIRQAHEIGRALAGLDVQVESVISSPLKRATQTASLVANELGHESKLQFADALHKQATWPKFQELLREQADKDAIMVVGHNPSLSEFLSLLISAGSSKTAVELRKGAVAKVEITGKRTATLSWCLTPKTVRAVYESGGSKSHEKTSRK
jgi:phosphohistidine phosphatase